MQALNTIQRIREYIDYKGISVRLFEQTVGMSNGSFASQLKNNRTIGVDKLEYILKVYDEINPTWLLTGKGDMIIQPCTTVSNKKERASTAIYLHDGDGFGIPLITSEAFAGYGNGEVIDAQFHGEKYFIPLFSGADFMIPVKGSSMSPKFHSGDVVACKKLLLSDIFFQWNKVYVINTDQGVLVKRIKKSNRSDHILLVSENALYEPFELHFTQIKAIAIVLGVIRLE